MHISYVNNATPITTNYARGIIRCTRNAHQDLQMMNEMNPIAKAIKFQRKKKSCHVQAFAMFCAYFMAGRKMKVKFKRVVLLHLNELS